MTTIVLCANNIQELGGAQKVVHTLAKGFADRGHDVHVVGITPVDDRHPYATNYSTKTLMDSVWPLRTPTNGDKGNKDHTNKELRETLRGAAVSKLRTLLNSLESGVIISAQLWALEIVLDARTETQRNSWPIFGQYHGSFAAAASGRDILRAQKLAPACEYFTVLSDEDRDAFALAGLTNAMVMPNPLTISATQLSEARSVVRGDSIDFVGRLSEEKGPDLLLEAWALLQEQNRKLIFTGTGPLQESLRTRAQNLLNVEFHLPVPDPAPVIARSGVVVIPSRTEGAPLVLAEALALGTPVVVADASSGIRSMVHGNPRVVVVERENPAALAEGIKRALALDVNAPVNYPPISNQEIYERWESLFKGASWLG